MGALSPGLAPLGSPTRQRKGVGKLVRPSPTVRQHTRRELLVLSHDGGSRGDSRHSFGLCLGLPYPHNQHNRYALLNRR